MSGEEIKQRMRAAMPVVS